MILSKYTIDIYTLLQEEDFSIFDFDYDFYTDDKNLKSSFEQKFLDTYLFNEIGQETVIRFKHFLKMKLNNIAPYYKQLYQTEIRCLDIDFMLNKDLTETYERLVESESTGKNDSTLKDNVSQGTKESYLDNGNASLSLSDGGLTGVTSSTSDNNSTSSSNSSTNDNQSEKTKLVSQGNIGVTSSAELLEKWRRVLINIDELIIEECRNLFMQIY
jgi:hypothetical protein